MKYYIYLHTTNEGVPFYIGKGKNERAYSKRSRNILWHNIVNKYGYKISILESELTNEEALEKEIYYINKYGRRDLNTGTLCNMTAGGEGCVNISQETKDKISNSLKGKIQSTETKEKRSATLVNVYKNNPDLVELKRQQTTELHKQGKCSRKGKPSNKKGKPFDGDKIKLSESLKKHYETNNVWNKVDIKVAQFDLDNNFIKNWNSHHSAAEFINGESKRILAVCKGKFKSHKKYIWKYI